MDIVLPVIPAGILVLLAFFTPYAIAALNAVLPFVKTPTARKVLSIVAAIILAAIVIVVYFLFGGTVTGYSIGALVILAVLVVAFSYGVVTKSSASALEARLTN